jgi:hypothetical protein
MRRYSDYRELMKGKKGMKAIIILVFLVSLMVIAGSYSRSLWHPSGNRYKIAMAGRSTMRLWFKHWNWPYPLRVKGTYREWPIPYKQYTKGDLYLEYLILKRPSQEEAESPFGKWMLDSFAEGLSYTDYDASFFKFCYVDFIVRGGDSYLDRFEYLTLTIRAVYGITSSKGVLLIIGNALPMTDSSDDVIEIQRKFNTWLLEFAAAKSDVEIFDFFSPLTDEGGRLKLEFARSANDTHLGEKAFSKLDKLFFPQVSGWLSPITDSSSSSWNKSIQEKNNQFS